MFKLELSDQHIAVIARALGQQPYAAVAQTIAEIQRQIDPQRVMVPNANGKDENPHLNG